MSRPLRKSSRIWISVSFLKTISAQSYLILSLPFYDACFDQERGIAAAMVPLLLDTEHMMTMSLVFDCLRVYPLLSVGANDAVCECILFCLSMQPATSAVHVFDQCCVWMQTILCASAFYTVCQYNQCCAWMQHCMWVQTVLCGVINDALCQCNQYTITDKIIQRIVMVSHRQSL